MTEEKEPAITIDEETDPATLPDEQLNALSEGQEPPSAESEEESGSSENEGGEPEGGQESSTGESEEESGSSQSEEDDLSWLPQQLQEKWKAGEKDEVSRQLAEYHRNLEQKMGQNSEFAPLVELLRADEELRQKVLNVVTGDEPAKEPDADDGKSRDPIAQRISALEEKLEPDVASLLKDMYSEMGNLRNLADQKVSEYDRRMQQKMVQRNNDAAVSDFLADDFIQKNDPTLVNDTGALINFAKKAERLVRPSGQMGEYTPDDLKAAWRLLNPEKYEKAVASQAIEKFKKSMASAANGNENTASAGQPSNASRDSSVPKIKEPQNRREAMSIASGLTEEELAEAMGENNQRENKPLWWLR